MSSESQDLEYLTKLWIDFFTFSEFLTYTHSLRIFFIGIGQQPLLMGPELGRCSFRPTLSMIFFGEKLYYVCMIKNIFMHIL